MVKYIGADKSGNANDTFRPANINPTPLNGSDRSFQFAAQQQQQLGESLKNSLAFQSQTAQRMSEDFSRTNQQAAQSRSLEIQSSAQSGQGFQQALGNLANVGQMIVQTLDNRSKAEAASAKAVREQNASNLWSKVSQWEVDAPAKARLDPGGLATLRNEAADLFNSTEGADLLPEDREKLMKHVYGNVIGGIATKNVEDLVTQQRKLNEVNDNAATQRSIFESSQLLAALSNSGTREEQGIAVAKLSEYVGKIVLSDELKPMRKAEIILGLTTAMNKATFSSEDNQAKTRELAIQFNSFQQDVAEARSKYPDDPESQNAAIAYSAFRNKIPTSVSDNYDPVKAQQRANDRVKLNNESRDLRDAQVAREIGVAGTDYEAGYDAVKFGDGDNMTALALALGSNNAELGKKTGRYLKAVDALETVKKLKQYNQTLSEDLANLAKEKTLVSSQDAQANLEYLRTLKPSPQADELRKQIEFASRNNPALQAMLPLLGQYQQLDVQKKAAFDNAYAQATAQGFDARAERIRAIDNLAIVKRQGLNEYIYKAAKYGFRSDGTFDPQLAKEIDAADAKKYAEQRAREYQQQFGSQGGTTDGAPFDRNTQYFNGLEVFEEDGGMVMPITKAEIKRQGKANINEGVGWRAWAGREHNGQDIGVDLGTPISAQMDGKVTRVWGASDAGAGSSGNTVEITYPDGSRHVFMHLQERSSLAVGQRVRAGQVVGKAGNTGLPGGNSNVNNVHLHWEVWHGDTRSTPQEWSKKYKERMSTLAKQPRGGGPGASITAPVRDVGGVPIKGGVLLPNGKGGASVASYSGTTMNVQQVKQAYDVPTPVKVDLTKAGQVLVQRTGRKDTRGLEDLVVTVYDSKGLPAGSYLTNSGSPEMQSAFGGAGTTVAGSNAPLEYGKYSIGQGVDATDIPGMRSQFIPIEPQFNTQRSQLGIHFDGDANIKPGSAGCIVFPTKTSFDAFHSAIKKNGNKQLVFDPQLKDSGQQKQRPTIKSPQYEYNGKVIYGPGGSRFGRDVNGNLFALPKPQGVSSDGVTSSPANYSGANPLRNLRNSNRTSDYNINDITNTHGFKALKDKPSAARTINEVARDFGVPGEWLAEVISIETENTFRTDIKERGGSGATGLIQFYPDVRGGTTKTINGRVYNLSDIGAMTIEQQLRGPVKDYLTEAMRSNGMKKIPTIQDLYALVWAYGPASKARRMRDEHGPSGTEILNRLGKFSGRRYSSHTNHSSNLAQGDTYQSDRASKLTTRVDQRPVASCATCTQMVASNMFVPHERVNLSTGMDTFNLA